MPVPAGEFCEKRKPCVPEESELRHGPQRLDLEKTISFGVISPSKHDRSEKASNHFRFHLPISVEFHNHICARLQGRAITCHGGSPNTLVFGVADHHHPWIDASSANMFPAAIRTGVVHAINR